MTVQSCNRAVTFEKSPQRVMTIGSTAQPMVAAAGAAGKIVAGSFDQAPFPGKYEAALKGIPEVSPEQEPSREVIVGQRPDLVIAYSGTQITEQDLGDAGIKFLNNTFCPGTKGAFDEIFADISLYGRVLGTEDKAAQEVAALRERLAAVEKQVKKVPDGRRAAALALNRGAIKAYGNPSTIGKQMETLGLKNVFGDFDKRLSEINAETLIQRDPEVIILVYLQSQTPESIKKNLLDLPGVRGITAIRNDDIAAFPFGYTGPGPVAVEGLEVLAKTIATSK